MASPSSSLTKDQPSGVVRSTPAIHMLESPPSFKLVKESPLTPAPSPVPRVTTIQQNRISHLTLPSPPIITSVTTPQSMQSLIKNKNNRNNGYAASAATVDPLIHTTRSAILNHFRGLDDYTRAQVLHSLLDSCERQVLVDTINYISPKLKRDPFAVLPNELSLKILSYIDDPKTLSRASQVSRLWHLILSDDLTWKALCQSHHFRRLSAAISVCPSQAGASNIRDNSDVSGGSYINDRRTSVGKASDSEDDISNYSPSATNKSTESLDRCLSDSFGSHIPSLTSAMYNPQAMKRPHPTSYRSHFRYQYLQNSEWEHGGRLAAKYVVSAPVVVTSLVMDSKYIVASLENSNIYVFRADGKLLRTLFGNVMGVWALALRKNTLVSGGCDRDVRVWDLSTGHCTQILRGHVSTVRCLKMASDTVALSGARDNTIRVWDIVKGECLHVLEGHDSSVRCLEVYGDLCVSGSYDFTAKVWRISTGELMHTLNGHLSQIYSVAFDGKRIATGSLDTTIRIWDPESGSCLAVLQGHTSLVGQLQMFNDILVSGGSDGTIRVWDLNSFECRHRIAAHDNSVTTLQFDNERIVSGGSDGRVEVWELATARHIRTISGPFDAIWSIAFREDKLIIMASHAQRIYMELVSFMPPPETEEESGDKNANSDSNMLRSSHRNSPTSSGLCKFDAVTPFDEQAMDLD